MIEPTRVHDDAYDESADWLTLPDQVRFALAALAGLLGGSIERQSGDSDHVAHYLDSSFRNGDEMRRRIEALEKAARSDARDQAPSEVIRTRRVEVVDNYGVPRVILGTEDHPSEKYAGPEKRRESFYGMRTFQAADMARRNAGRPPTPLHRKAQERGGAP